MRHALSMTPRLPLGRWENFCRVAVMAWLAARSGGSGQTATAVRGRHIRNTFLNATEGSNATTCTATHHSRGRAKNHSPTSLVASIDDSQDLACVQLQDGCQS